MTATGYIGGDPTKVDVDGWTLGDVLAANASGVLEAVPLGAAAEVLTVVPAEPTDLGYEPGGGGGAVTSVFGRAGAVVAVAGDYAVGQVTGAASTVYVDAADAVLAAAIAAIRKLPLVSESGPVTSGNIAAAAGPGYTALGPEVSVAAVTGDILGVTIEALAGNSGPTLIFDAATRVAAVDVNYLSTGTAAKLFPGARPAWYVVDTAGAFIPAGGEVRYVVQAGDISAGAVTIQAYAAGEGNPRTVFANASFPLRVWVTNYGPGTP